MSTAFPRLYLRSYLAPLAAFLDRDDVTDIYVNTPGEVWTESITGRVERHLRGLSHDVARGRGWRCPRSRACGAGPPGMRGAQTRHDLVGQ